MIAQTDPNPVGYTTVHYRGASHFSLTLLYGEYISPEDITAVRFTASRVEGSCTIILRGLVDPEVQSYDNVLGHILRQ